MAAASKDQLQSYFLGWSIPTPPVKRMIPWFIATEQFTPEDGRAWDKYVAWSGLTQLNEVVSLDPMLCPTVLPEVKDDYLPHIVRMDFMTQFFLNYDFLRCQISDIPRKNVLCVFLNPTQQPVAPSVSQFDFLGYDVLDIENSASALTNCGGFPEVFANSELSPSGLLPDFERASEVQRNLRLAFPNEFHADCHLWAIFRSASGAVQASEQPHSRPKSQS